MAEPETGTPENPRTEDFAGNLPPVDKTPVTLTPEKIEQAPVDLEAIDPATGEKINIGPTADDMAEQEKLLQKPEVPPGEETPPETPPASEQFYDNEADFLAEIGLGLEQDYPDVKSALLGLHKKNFELESRIGGETGQMSGKLNDLARKFNSTPEQVLNALDSAMDPTATAQQGPQWGNFEQFLGSVQFDNETDVNFHRGMAGAMLQDIQQSVEGLFARSYNQLHGQIQDLGLNWRIEKAIGKTDAQGKKINASWDGRHEEIRKVLAGELKHMKGKPNDVDVAMKYLTSTAPQKSVHRIAGELAAQKLKAIKENGRKLHVETGGRMPQPRVTPKDPEKMTQAEIDSELDRLEKAGAQIL